MISQLTFITGNAAKAEQLGRHFDFPVSHRKLDLDEIQSLELTPIVEHKVKQAYVIIGSPVLVEDVSLTFNALGKLPGPLVKWFLSSLDNVGLCRLLDGYNDRMAVAEVMFAVYDGRTITSAHGQMNGTIADQPRGTGSFGWDSIFIPAGQDKTWAEMTAEEQKNYSMRRQALKKLEMALKSGAAL